MDSAMFRNDKQLHFIVTIAKSFLIAKNWEMIFDQIVDEWKIISFSSHALDCISSMTIESAQKGWILATIWSIAKIHRCDF